MKNYEFNPSSICYGRVFSQQELESILEMKKYENVEKWQLAVLEFRKYLEKEGDRLGLTVFVRNYNSGIKILTPIESIDYGIRQFANNKTKLEKGTKKMKKIDRSLISKEDVVKLDTALINQSWVLKQLNKRRLSHVIR